MWSAALYHPYNSTTESIFALNGAYRKRVENNIVYDWGIDAPSKAPTLAVVSGGSLSGDYNVKYTYCRKEGTALVSESNPSGAAVSTLSPSSEDIRVTFGDPGNDQVNAIRFYRTINGGSTYYYDSEYSWAVGDFACTQTWEADDYITGDHYLFTVSDTTYYTRDCFNWEATHEDAADSDSSWVKTVRGDNYVFTFDLSTADANLGSEVHSDHDRPPQGSFVAGPSYNGTLFIIKDNKLHFSKPKEPEYFPSSYYIDVSPPQYPGKAIVFWNNQPMVLTKTKIYYISGTTASDFLPIEITAKTGTQSQQGAIAVEGYGIFHVGLDGVYLCVPSTDDRIGSDVKITDGFDPIFEGTTTNGIPAVSSLSSSWLAFLNDRLYFGYCDSDDTYPSHMLVFHMLQNRAVYYTLPTEIITVAVDNYNGRVFGADATGYIWHLDDPDSTDDDGTVIAWEVESKDYTLQTRAHFPRWVKYDVDASSAATCTGALFLDGSSRQTHTLSSNRNTRRRLVATGNGERCSLKVSGTGAVDIYMVESQ